MTVDQKRRLARRIERPGINGSTTSVRHGPGRPTHTQAKQRNLELLEKALDLFLENGFERTSIDAITASAGMAKRTVYLRYKNKTALFKAALQRAIEDWIVPIDKLRAAETEDLEESLLRIGQILVENIMSPAGLRLMRITNAESGRLPEIGIYAYKQGTERTVNYLADLFSRRTKLQNAETIDPKEAAQGFLYLVVGGPASVTAWGFVLKTADIDKHTRECVRLFLHGLLPRQKDASRRPAKDSQRHTNSQQSPSREVVGYTQTAGTEPERMKSLESENRRLKLLLAESMLELASQKEKRRADAD